jgi:hypothetical protein
VTGAEEVAGDGVTVQEVRMGRWDDPGSGSEGKIFMHLSLTQIFCW